jgi:hypothetical protein
MADRNDFLPDNYLKYGQRISFSVVLVALAGICLLLLGAIVLTVYAGRMIGAWCMP